MAASLGWSQNASSNYIVYSQNEMDLYKKICIEKILDPGYQKTNDYPLSRALKTISGTDCDYIPKVMGAGEIFTSHGVKYQLMHNGIKIIANSYYNSQWLTDVIHGLRGHHEPQEEKCFFEVLKHIPENATMIELGSYWAYYSLWFAQEIKGAKNYLIEPDSIRLQVGIENFKLNNRDGVFLRAFAGDFVEISDHASGAPHLSIDDFIESEKIDRVHILHSDIQGSEYSMLFTTTRHLDRIDYFFISTHGNCHRPCMAFLQEHGFRILAEHDCEESCSGDGLIVAKRNDVIGPEYISIRKYK